MTLDPNTHARRYDPDTSQAAATALSDKTTMMRRLLETYIANPRTTEEAIEAAGYGPEDGAWKRVSDLASEGWIEDTGARRVGHSGRRQMVRKITPEGMTEIGW